MCIRDRDGGFHIKGSKSFVSGSGHADAYLVAARSAADDSLVSPFLVPADAAGVTVEETWDSPATGAYSSPVLHSVVVVQEAAPSAGVEVLAVRAPQGIPGC